MLFTVLFAWVYFSGMVTTATLFWVNNGRKNPYWSLLYGLFFPVVLPVALAMTMVL